MLLAALTLVVTAGNTRFVRRFGQRNALIFTLLAAAYGTTVLHFVTLTPIALFVLYTWSALIGTVLGVQFWMFAGQRFTVTQGKRLFGPIAAGGVGGAVTGASAAAAALSLVPVTSLLLVSAALFLITAVFLTTVRAADPSLEPATATAVVESEAPQESVGELFRRYPYLRQMAVLAAFSSAALLVGDYLFKSIAAHRVPPEQLGAFFARTYAVLNALSLAVQLLLTGRVLRQVGVVPALLILPGLMLGGAAGVFLTGGAITMALVIKGADGSLQRVAGELLWMPLPSDVRTRSKALLDSVFGRLIQAVVASILLFLATFHLAPPRALAAIVAGLVVGWIGTIVAMRSSYLDLFRQALSRGTLDLSIEAHQRSGRDWVRRALVRQGDAAFEALLGMLRDPAMPMRRRVHLPRTIARFGSQRAVDVLTDLVVKDRQGFVRYKALRGLGRLAAGQDEGHRSTGNTAALRFDRALISAEMRRNLVEHLRLISVAAAIEERGSAPPEGAGEADASLVLGLLGDKQRPRRPRDGARARLARPGPQREARARLSLFTGPSWAPRRARRSAKGASFPGPPRANGAEA